MFLSLGALTLALGKSSYPPSSGPVLLLNNGVEMPRVGLGTWQAKDGEVYGSVLHALKEGYRHIDTAWIYFNQDQIAKAIKDSGVPREDIFVTSKVWMTFFNPQEMREGVLENLRQLQTDYVDQMLMHWPVSWKKQMKDGEVDPFPEDSAGNKLHDLSHSLLESWKVLEDLYLEGALKSIGVSNFDIDEMRPLMHSKVPPAVNQVELHPSWPQNALVKFCHDHDVQVVAYAPLGNPSLSREGLTHPQPLKHPVVLQIAEKVDKTPAQILLKWGLQRGLVVIPKSVKNSRVSENFHLFDFELNPSQMDMISALGARKEGRTRMFNPPFRAPTAEGEGDALVFGDDLGEDDLPELQGLLGPEEVGSEAEL